jgi:hypothetical protein
MHALLAGSSLARAAQADLLHPLLGPITSPRQPIAALLIIPVLLMIHRENPAKYPSLAKNPPKYTIAYTIQWSNGRWQTYILLMLGLNNESLFPPSLSNLSISYLSISNLSLS